MSDTTDKIIGGMGLAFSLLSGGWFVLWNRIRQVESAQSGINVEVREEMQKLGGELRQSMQTQASDHRLEQNNLRGEFRRFVDKNSEHQVHAAEAIGKLSTRDDMEKMRDTMSANMIAMEGRIMISLRKEVPNR